MPGPEAMPHRKRHMVTGRFSRRAAVFLAAAFLLAFTGLHHQPTQPRRHDLGRLDRSVEELLPKQVLLRVPGQDQFPELPNGCEVTSLSMLLSAIGHPISKMRLAQLMPRDDTPRVATGSGHIVSWGDPNVGFVGSIYVGSAGFGMYHRPLLRLVDRLLPRRGVDLTEEPFHRLLALVAAGTPVVVWTTFSFHPDVPWTTWRSPEGLVRATFDEHAVLLVGYTRRDVFLNNPANGEAAEAVPRRQFERTWQVMGRQAVSVMRLTVARGDRCVQKLAACRPAGSWSRSQGISG